MYLYFRKTPHKEYDNYVIAITEDHFTFSYETSEAKLGFATASAEWVQAGAKL